MAAEWATGKTEERWAPLGTGRAPHLALLLRGHVDLDALQCAGRFTARRLCRPETEERRLCPDGHGDSAIEAVHEEGRDGSKVAVKPQQRNIVVVLEI